MTHIILVGCGKTKRAERSAARDLYTGPLFRARRDYAEASGEPWYIVSALYGLVQPDVELKPYDLTVGELCEPDRAAWALCSVRAILDDLPDEAKLGAITLELHAGAAYAEPLIAVAKAIGFWCEWPVARLGIGEQLAWYAAAAKQRDGRAA